MNDNNTPGRLPPQALEMEELVLGAIVLESEALQVVSEILKPESFYKSSNRIIYASAMRLYAKGDPVDMATVAKDLRDRKELDLAGGVYYISQLTNRVASSAHVEFHARIVQQKYVQRELIKISSETIHRAHSDLDIFEILDYLEKSLTSITGSVLTGAKVKDMKILWNEVKERNNILLSKNGLTGVPSGFKDLDSVTGGWQSPDLIIVAARPAMGKTSLVCNFARNASVGHNIPGAIFSLEMSAIQIATRMFAMESHTGTGRFSRTGIPAPEMFHVESDCKLLIGSPLWIDDAPGISLADLKSKVRKLKREKNIQWVIVDYLQLMEGAKGESRANREQVISSISRGLKGIAKELNIPVIAISQLSRAVETRGGEKKPQLSDLRESGAIEQDADMVIFLHRPEYYNITEDEAGMPTAGMAELIIAKHRNGGTGTEKLRWIAHLTKFANLVEEPYGSAIASAPHPDKRIEPLAYAEEPEEPEEDLPF